ncbi:MAG: hypothetical protein LBJ47_07045 [Tannerella sp.]|jgi:hypothetical protein|nr:hypothetical protein [Tannerella sp.]
MLRTATDSMPESPSPKDVISITAGRRPAANILLLPERQDRFRIDNGVLPYQAANRRYLPQAALCLPAVMKITPSGRAGLPVYGATVRGNSFQTLFYLHTVVITFPLTRILTSQIRPSPHPYECMPLRK